MLLASLYLPADAHFEATSDGFAFVFADPTTRIQVYERLVPLRGAREIFDAALGAPTTIPYRECLTRAGEHAALLGVATTARHGLLGVAYGDDSYRLVVGHTTDVTRAGDIAACVRRLTLELPMGLGDDRRRRYRYSPPAGWRSLTRHGLITEWFAPKFPSNPTMITVFPSSPLRELPSRAFDRNIHEMRWGGFSERSSAGPLALAMPQLQAEEMHFVGTWRDGAPAYVDLVVLFDTARTYIVRLDHDGTHTDEYRAVLYDLARSVQPIGRTATQASAGAAAARALLHVAD
ncbi:MAG: hypothetical protein ACKV2T_41285 [Kofleriaceae bacterium]